MAEILGDAAVVGDSTVAFKGLEDILRKELKTMLPKALSNRVEVRVPSGDDLEHKLVRLWLKLS